MLEREMIFIPSQFLYVDLVKQWERGDSESLIRMDT